MTATRVAKVPEPEFDAAVESDSPPGAGALAKRGTARRPLLDLKGRDPEEFKLATQVQAHVDPLFKLCKTVDPTAVASGSFPGERAVLRKQIPIVDQWLRKFGRAIKQAGAGR